MAEATAFRNNALPYPVYGAAWTIVFPMRDADGDLVTGATTPDAERSLNGDTFADCTNESTEIATASGVYYLTLTAAEMTADIVAVIAKSATAGMKTAVATLYPRKLPILKASATTEGGASGSITLDAATAVAVDDYYNGALIIAVLDGATEARVCSDYVGSTRVASVIPNWNTTPDSDDTCIIYDTDLRQYKQADVTAWKSVAAATVHTAGYPVVTIKDGTGTGEIDTTSGGVLVAAIANGAITAAAIATDAIDADAMADGAITAATFAANAITATVLANDTITADKLAADCITAAKIASAAIDADSIAADAIGASELAASAVAEIALAVNAEVLDVLNVDTFAEPGQGTPAATTTLAGKIGYLYKAWRNRTTQTATEYALYSDDGTTKDHESVVSDNGVTFERGEVTTGA